MNWLDQIKKAFIKDLYALLEKHNANLEDAEECYVKICVDEDIEPGVKSAYVDIGNLWKYDHLFQKERQAYE